MTKTTIENYQERAKRTLPDLGSQAANGMHMAAGIVTEIGEMVDGMAENNLINIKEEHGDCNWYVANLCNIYDLRFEVIYNVAKTAIADGNFQTFKIHELVDMHKRELAYKKEIDPKGLFVQLVKLVQELIIVTTNYNFSFEESLDTNINKLFQRYPDKFTEEDALNRDLQKEGEILSK